MDQKTRVICFLLLAIILFSGCYCVHYHYYGYDPDVAKNKKLCKEILAPGIYAYSNFSYKDASRDFKNIVGQEDIQNSIRAEAAFYCGASSFLLGNSQDAGCWFRKVLKYNPQFSPDTNIFKPKIVELYYSVRNQSIN